MVGVHRMRIWVADYSCGVGTRGREKGRSLVTIGSGETLGRAIGRCGLMIGGWMLYAALKIRQPTPYGKCDRQIDETV